jgi:DnaJ family protein B protein 13
LRDIYDKYGEEILKNGVIDERGQVIGGYRFSGNSLAIFEGFFGTSNPFTIALDDNGNQIQMIQKFQPHLYRLFSKKFFDLTVNIEVTLEEFFHGCSKTVYYERIVLNEDQRTDRFELTRKEIEIKPGMGPWTEIKFPGEGHQIFGKEPSELIIKFV